MEMSEISSPELLEKLLDPDRLREDLIKERQQIIDRLNNPNRPLTTKERKIGIDVIYVSQSDNIRLPRTQQ